MCILYPYLILLPVWLCRVLVVFLVLCQHRYLQRTACPFLLRHLCLAHFPPYLRHCIPTHCSILVPYRTSLSRHHCTKSTPTPHTHLYQNLPALHSRARVLPTRALVKRTAGVVGLQHCLQPTHRVHHAAHMHKQDMTCAVIIPRRAGGVTVRSTVALPIPDNGCLLIR